MRINALKTKLVVSERNEKLYKCKIELNGVNMKQINEFVYFGSMFQRGSH